MNQDVNVASVEVYIGCASVFSHRALWRSLFRPCRTSSTDFIIEIKKWVSVDFSHHDCYCSFNSFIQLTIFFAYPYKGPPKSTTNFKFLRRSGKAPPSALLRAHSTACSQRCHATASQYSNPIQSWLAAWGDSLISTHHFYFFLWQCWNMRRKNEPRFQRAGVMHVLEQ